MGSNTMDYNMGYYDNMSNGYAPRPMNRGGYSDMYAPQPARYEDNDPRYRDERAAREGRDNRRNGRREEDAAARYRDNRRSRDVPASRRGAGRGPMPVRDQDYNMRPMMGDNMRPMMGDNMFGSMNSNQNLWDNFLDMSNPVGYTDGSRGPYNRPEYAATSHRMPPPS